MGQKCKSNLVAKISFYWPISFFPDQIWLAILEFLQLVFLALVNYTGVTLAMVIYRSAVPLK